MLRVDKVAPGMIKPSCRHVNTGVGSPVTTTARTASCPSDAEIDVGCDTMTGGTWTVTVAAVDVTVVPTPLDTSTVYTPSSALVSGVISSSLLVSPARTVPSRFHWYVMMLGSPVAATKRKSDEPASSVCVDGAGCVVIVAGTCTVKFDEESLTSGFYIECDWDSLAAVLQHKSICMGEDKGHMRQAKPEVIKEEIPVKRVKMQVAAQAQEAHTCHAFAPQGEPLLRGEQG
jgi:hypothetical protein